VDDAVVELEEAPLCPRCRASRMMPLALMFDEDYTSHAYYQFDRAMAWLEEAEVGGD
jgi:NAD-dependent deacetylase